MYINSRSHIAFESFDPALAINRNNWLIIYDCACACQCTHSIYGPVRDGDVWSRRELQQLYGSTSEPKPYGKKMKTP